MFLAKRYIFHLHIEHIIMKLAIMYRISLSKNRFSESLNDKNPYV